MATIAVRIVSAEEEIFSGTASAVFASAEMGEVGIFPQHAPLLTRLRPGNVRVQRAGADVEYFFISGGLLEVQPSIVTVLADTAVRGADLDESRAEEARRRAEKALQSKMTEQETARAMAELAQAAEQLRMIKELRKMRRQ